MFCIFAVGSADSYKKPVQTHTHTQTKNLTNCFHTIVNLKPVAVSIKPSEEMLFYFKEKHEQKGLKSMVGQHGPPKYYVVLLGEK